MSTEPIKIGMSPPHPGEFIRDEIELGLNVSKAAKALGVRRATLSDLLNGKANLSPEMALRIEKAFHQAFIGHGAAPLAALANHLSSASTLADFPDY